jgi:hypothetical protein
VTRVELSSFKLRIAEGHVRAVPRTDARGCPFSGPGVDLRGDEAARVFAAAAPLVAALVEVEPGVVVRSIAVDLSRPRVTATLDPGTPATDARPRVVRVDEGPLLHRLLDASGPAVEMLSMAAAQALARRQEPGT